MKSITKLLLPLLVLFATTAFAEEKQTQSEKMRSVCTSVSVLAEITMKERQLGAPMREMMNRANGRQPNEDIVIAAYQHPAYSTAEIRQKTINEFADNWYLQCARYWETQK